MKNSHSLRRWLMLQFALVASVPLVIVAALVWLSLLPRMHTDIAIRHQSLARAIAGRVAAHLTDAEQELRALAGYIGAQGQHPATFWFDLLDAHAGTGEVFEAIYITDASDEVFTVGLPQKRRGRREDLIGLYLSHREFIREAREKRMVVWSETFLSTVSSRLAVGLAIPMADRAIIGEITVDRLSDFVSELPYEPGLFTLILDYRGQIIADSRRGFAGQQFSTESLPQFRHESMEHLEASSFEMEGEELIGTVVPVERVGWKVLVAQPHQDAFAHVTAALRMVASALIFSLLMAVVAGWLLSRRIARHFEHYRKQAGILADGGRDVPWMESNIREFAELADNLQRTSHAIQEREGKLAASEEKYRNLFETMAQGVVYVDADGRIESANPAAERILGFDLERMKGYTLSGLHQRAIGEDGRTLEDEEMPIMVALRTGREVRNVGVGLVNEPNDKTIWVNVNAAPRFVPGEEKPSQVYATFEDITERKQAEEALRLSESNLMITLDSIGDAVIATDTLGRITRMNPIAEELTGWPEEEAREQPLTEVFHIINAHSRQRVENPAEKVLARGQIVGLANHTVLVARNGVEYQIADSGSPIRKPDGEIVGVVLVFRDVTESYAQAQKIQESEQLLRSITTRIPGVVFRFCAASAQEFGNTYVSEKSADMLGLSVPPEDFFTAFAACIPDTEKDRFMASIHEAVEQVIPWQYEGQFLKPSGDAIWFQGSSMPHREGSLIVFDGVLIDITERRRAETELRQLRNYLSNIIDSMPSVLVGVDAEGRVTQWNRQAQRRTGVEAGSALGQPFQAAHPLLSSKLSAVRETMNSGKIHSEQKVPRHIDGEIRYEDFIIYPLVTNGVEGAVIRVDDVTERVRLEEMMIQSEKMLSIGGLAAGMAHEINNPLAGIIQNAIVLENRLSGDIEPNHRAAEASGTSMAVIRAYLDARGLVGLLSNIRESGNRAARIVRNMLEFARKSDRAFSSHDLGQVLDDTVELAASDYDLKKDYDFKKIRIERDYAADLPKVPCEKPKIQQVILNILKNGAEAMASEGTCDGQPPRFILRTRWEGDMARIEIEDNGPGMDETTRKRVFEPFFTTKPVNRGTGLGLSVSYFIITEDHGGTLTVSSLEGNGTVFVIRLPLTGRVHA